MRLPSLTLAVLTLALPAARAQDSSASEASVSDASAANAPAAENPPVPSGADSPPAPPAAENPPPAEPARELEAGAPPQANQRYRIGIDLYRKGDYAGAAREFRVAMALAPRSPKLAYNAARSLERSGDLEGAIRSYKSYLALSPEATDRSAVEQVIDVLKAELARKTAPAPASAAVSAPAEAEMSNREVAMWATGGTAFAAAIVGGVFAVQASGARSDAEGLDASETSRHRALEDDYETGRLGAGVGLGLAGALAVSCLVLYFLPDEALSW